jgi:hypothetical protein
MPKRADEFEAYQGDLSDAESICLAWPTPPVEARIDES